MTIEHKYGSTEITAEPQRVVLVGLNEQDALLALGKVPVATSNFLDVDGGIFPWAEAALGGAPKPVLLDQTDGIPYEKVAELTPDLIVGLYSGLTDEQYATLSKIAPVVAQPTGQKDYSVSWEDTTLTVGKILGKPAEAQKLVDDTEARFAQERSAHPEFAGKSGVGATFYEGYYFYGAEDPRGRLLGSLGFTVPPDLAQFIDSDGFGGTVPAERASVLDTDAIVWVGPDTPARAVGCGPGLQPARRVDAGPRGVPERERHAGQGVLVRDAAEHPLPARRAGPAAVGGGRRRPGHRRSVTRVVTSRPDGLDGVGLHLAYHDRAVVHGADIRLRAGRITALVGPNGSGKSTLLRARSRGCTGRSPATRHLAPALRRGGGVVAEALRVCEVAADSARRPGGLRSDDRNDQRLRPTPSTARRPARPRGRSSGRPSGPSPSGTTRRRARSPA